MNKQYLQSDPKLNLNEEYYLFIIFALIEAHINSNIGSNTNNMLNIFQKMNRFIAYDEKILEYYYEHEKIHVHDLFSDLNQKIYRIITSDNSITYDYIESIYDESILFYCFLVAKDSHTVTIVLDFFSSKIVFIDTNHNLIIRNLYSKIIKMDLNNDEIKLLSKHEKNIKKLEIIKQVYNIAKKINETSYILYLHNLIFNTEYYGSHPEDLGNYKFIEKCTKQMKGTCVFYSIKYMFMYILTVYLLSKKTYANDFELIENGNRISEKYNDYVHDYAVFNLSNIDLNDFYNGMKNVDNNGYVHMNFFHCLGFILNRYVKNKKLNSELNNNFEEKIKIYEKFQKESIRFVYAEIKKEEEKFNFNENPTFTSFNYYLENIKNLNYLRHYIYYLKNIDSFDKMDTFKINIWYLLTYIYLERNIIKSYSILLKFFEKIDINDKTIVSKFDVLLFICVSILNRYKNFIPIYGLLFLIIFRILDANQDVFIFSNDDETKLTHQNMNNLYFASSKKYEESSKIINKYQRYGYLPSLKIEYINFLNRKTKSTNISLFLSMIFNVDFYNIENENNNLYISGINSIDDIKNGVISIEYVFFTEMNDRVYVNNNGGSTLINLMVHSLMVPKNILADYENNIFDIIYITNNKNDEYFDFVYENPYNLIKSGLLNYRLFDIITNYNNRLLIPDVVKPEHNTINFYSNYIDENNNFYYQIRKEFNDFFDRIFLEKKITKKMSFEEYFLIYIYFLFFRMNDENLEKYKLPFNIMNIYMTKIFKHYSFLNIFYIDKENIREHYSNIFQIDKEEEEEENENENTRMNMKSNFQLKFIDLLFIENILAPNLFEIIDTVDLFGIICEKSYHPKYNYEFTLNDKKYYLTEKKNEYYEKNLKMYSFFRKYKLFVDDETYNLYLLSNILPNLIITNDELLFMDDIKKKYNGVNDGGFSFIDRNNNKKIIYDVLSFYLNKILLIDHIDDEEYIFGKKVITNIVPYILNDFPEYGVKIYVTENKLYILISNFEFNFKKILENDYIYIESGKNLWSEKNRNDIINKFKNIHLIHDQNVFFEYSISFTNYESYEINDVEINDYESSLILFYILNLNHSYKLQMLLYNKFLSFLYTEIKNINHPYNILINQILFFDNTTKEKETYRFFYRGETNIKISEQKFLFYDYIRIVWNEYHSEEIDKINYFEKDLLSGLSNFEERFKRSNYLEGKTFQYKNINGEFTQKDCIDNVQNFIKKSENKVIEIMMGKGKSTVIIPYIVLEIMFKNNIFRYNALKMLIYGLKNIIDEKEPIGVTNLFMHINVKKSSLIHQNGDFTFIDEFKDDNNEKYSFVYNTLKPTLLDYGSDIRYKMTLHLKYNMCTSFNFLVMDDDNYDYDYEDYYSEKYENQVVIIAPSHLVNDLYQNILKCAKTMPPTFIKKIENIDEAHYLSTQNNCIIVISDVLIKHSLLVFKNKILKKNRILFIDEIDDCINPLKSNFNIKENSSPISSHIKFYEKLYDFIMDCVNKYIKNDLLCGNYKTLFFRIFKNTEIISKMEEICNDEHKTITKNIYDKNNKNIFYLLNKIYEIIKFLSKYHYLKDYGLHTDPKKKSFYYAIPYAYINTPSENSEFNDVLLVAILTTFIFKKYKNIRDEDIYTFSKIIMKSSSKKYDKFQKISRNLYDIDSDMFMQPKKYIKYIIDNNHLDNFISLYLKEYILNTILYTTNYENTSFMDILSPFFSNNIIGFTGTSEYIGKIKYVENSKKKISYPLLIGPNDTYEKVFNVDDTSFSSKTNDLKKIDSFFKDYVKEKMSSNNIIAYIEKYNKINLKQKINCIIDVAGVFKYKKTYEYAKDISENSNLNIVYYFTNNDELYVYTNSDNSTKPYPLKNGKKHIETLENSLIFFDNKHTRGTDIILPNNANAVLIINNSCDSVNVLQGLYRLRKIDQGQKCQFYVDNTINEILEPNGIYSIYKYLENNTEYFLNSQYNELLTQTFLCNIRWKPGGYYTNKKISNMLFPNFSKINNVSHIIKKNHTLNKYLELCRNIETTQIKIKNLCNAIEPQINVKNINISQSSSISKSKSISESKNISTQLSQSLSIHRHGNDLYKNNRPLPTIRGIKIHNGPIPSLKYDYLGLFLYNSLFNPNLTTQKKNNYYNSYIKYVKKIEKEKTSKK
jgi:hypothetical protein